MKLRGNKGILASMSGFFHKIVAGGCQCFGNQSQTPLDLVKDKFSMFVETSVLMIKLISALSLSCIKVGLCRLSETLLQEDILYLTLLNHDLFKIPDLSRFHFQSTGKSAGAALHGRDLCRQSRTRSSRRYERRH